MRAISWARLHGLHGLFEGADLILKRGEVSGDDFVLVRVFERVRAAVWRVEAIQSHVAAAFAWSLAIAFNFASLAFVTSRG